MNARRATVNIAVEGVDITSSILPYLKSMSYIDNEEDETDELQIQLHDREAIWMEKWLNELIDASVSSGSGRENVSDGYGGRTGVGGDGISTPWPTGQLTDMQIQQGGFLYLYNLPGDNLIGNRSGTAPQAAGGRVSTGLMMDANIILENWTQGGGAAALRCGRFELDSAAASGPPAVITLKCTSLPFKTRVRQTKQSRAWEYYTLSGIAREIARSNGMSCMYESAFNPFYVRVEQTKTSDSQFLETLCHNAGISLKMTDNTVVLFDQAAYEARPAVCAIRRGDGTYTKYKLSAGTADTKYASCRVSYTPPGGGCIQGIARVEDYNADAKNNQQLEITAKVDSQEEARALAAKLLRRHNRYATTASFTLPGAYSLVAGVTVMLERWGAWNGKYIVSQAKHTVSGGGYVVDVKLRKVLEGY